MIRPRYRFEYEGDAAKCLALEVCPAEVQARCTLTPSFQVAEFLQSLTVTPESRVAIAALRQRGSDWHKARFGRVTASVAFAASGLGGKAAQRDLIRNMTWPEYGVLTGYARSAADYGTLSEATNISVYEANRRVRDGLGWKGLRVFETGLLVSEEYPWLGASLDGCVDELQPMLSAPVCAAPIRQSHISAPTLISHPEGADAFVQNNLAKCGSVPADYTSNACGCMCRDSSGVVRRDIVAPCEWSHGCVEAKCPATGCLYSSNPAHGENLFPEQYCVQQMVQMFVSNTEWCDASVYTPECTEVIRFKFDPTKWADLLRRLKSFYFGMLLPTFEMRAKGLLREGEIMPPAKPPRNIPRLAHILPLVTQEKEEQQAAQQLTQSQGCGALCKPLKKRARTPA
jgi:hypothetical protein